MTPEPEESTSVTALTELLRNAVKRPSATELDRGYHELSARLTDTGRRPAARRFVWLVVVSIGLVLGGVGFLVSRNPPSVAVSVPVLTKIEGGKLLAGGYLSESDPAGIRLFFDEGSRFLLSPGTRGRLRGADSDGVRLAIEHGTAALTITPRPGHRWSVEAGPFLVTVQGTEFTVSWEPSSERFELRLRRGQVAVSGPIVGDGFVLHTGQKLSVSLPNAETIISEERPDRTTDATPAPVAVSSAASEGRSPKGGDAVAQQKLAQPSASGRFVAERRWRDALARGAWDEILADAERTGTEATLETASSDELFVLCDAARYRRRVDLARAALLAQRRRFPSSPRSTDALFLLGRVEELRAGGSPPALAYYDEYLSRAPAGTYAAEALGRKMVLLKDGSGPESARAIAAEYLRRFPNGSYAGAARALERTRRTEP